MNLFISFDCSQFLHNAPQHKSATCKSGRSKSPRSSPKLLLQDPLQRDGVGGELGDTLPQLLDGHGLFVEVEAEFGFVIDVAFLLDVQAARGFGVEFLGDSVFGLVERFEEVGLQKGKEKIR